MVNRNVFMYTCEAVVRHVLGKVQAGEAREWKRADDHP